MKQKEEWKSRRLSDEAIKGILHCGKDPAMSQREIAMMYQISQAYVSRLLNGKATRVARAGE